MGFFSNALVENRGFIHNTGSFYGIYTMECLAYDAVSQYFQEKKTKNRFFLFEMLIFLNILSFLWRKSNWYSFTNEAFFV